MKTPLPSKAFEIDRAANCVQLPKADVQISGTEQIVSETAMQLAEGTDVSPVVIPGEQQISSSTSTESTRTEIESENDHFILKNYDANPHGAVTDYLNFTFPFDGENNSLFRFIEVLQHKTDGCFGEMGRRPAGHLNFDISYNFQYGKAIFAFGCKGNSALLSIPGKGCQLIKSWQNIVDLIQFLNGRITRWDGAVDDLYGTHPVELAKEWYDAGKFNVRGKKPTYVLHGDWHEPIGHGRTLEIGRRRSGKMLRVYEKGKQLGFPHNPWIRWELELHNSQREIPLDVLISPGQYVAGSYPCMDWFYHSANRIKTIRNTSSADYQKTCDHLKRSYGSFLNLMMILEGSAENVLKKVIRADIPERFREGIPLEVLFGQNDEA